ncbi:unnamed protein product, partial [Musa textilis]
PPPPPPPSHCSNGGIPQAQALRHRRDRHRDGLFRGREGGRRRGSCSQPHLRSLSLVRHCLSCCFFVRPRLRLSLLLSDMFTCHLCRSIFFSFRPSFAMGGFD